MLRRAVIFAKVAIENLGRWMGMDIHKPSMAQSLAPSMTVSASPLYSRPIKEIVFPSNAKSPPRR